MLLFSGLENGGSVPWFWVTFIAMGDRWLRFIFSVGSAFESRSNRLNDTRTGGGWRFYFALQFSKMSCVEWFAQYIQTYPIYLERKLPRHHAESTHFNYIIGKIGLRYAPTYETLITWREVISSKKNISSRTPLVDPVSQSATECSPVRFCAASIRRPQTDKEHQLLFEEGDWSKRWTESWIVRKRWFNCVLVVVVVQSVWGDILHENLLSSFCGSN